MTPLARLLTVLAILLVSDAKKPNHIHPLHPVKAPSFKETKQQTRVKAWTWPTIGLENELAGVNFRGRNGGNDLYASDGLVIYQSAASNYGPQLPNFRIVIDNAGCNAANAVGGVAAAVAGQSAMNVGFNCAGIIEMVTGANQVGDQNNDALWQAEYAMSDFMLALQEVSVLTNQDCQHNWCNLRAAMDQFNIKMRFRGNQDVNTRIAHARGRGANYDNWVLAPVGAVHQQGTTWEFQCPAGCFALNNGAGTQTNFGLPLSRIDHDNFIAGIATSAVGAQVTKRQRWEVARTAVRAFLGAQLNAHAADARLRGLLEILVAQSWNHCMKVTAGGVYGSGPHKNQFGILPKVTISELVARITAAGNAWNAGLVALQGLVAGGGGGAVAARAALGAAVRAALHALPGGVGGFGLDTAEIPAPGGGAVGCVAQTLDICAEHALTGAAPVAAPGAPAINNFPAGWAAWVGGAGGAAGGAASFLCDEMVATERPLAAQAPAGQGDDIGIVGEVRVPGNAGPNGDFTPRPPQYNGNQQFTGVLRVPTGEDQHGQMANRIVQFEAGQDTEAVGMGLARPAIRLALGGNVPGSRVHDPATGIADIQAITG